MRHLFVTHDGELFHMIEDETGDIFWGYGHRESAEFIGEINRWLIHVDAVTDPGDLLHPETHHIEHLWVRMDDPEGERFTVVAQPWLGTKESADDLLPVTRLML